MRLYGYWRSSSTWRVRIALDYKGVKYENVPVHLVKAGGEQNTADYRAKNPLGQVPTLELSGGSGPLYFTQSVAIIEYLEERHPEPSLLPREPEARARARELAEIINSGIQPLQNLSVLSEVKERFGADPKTWAARFIAQGLAVLERRVLSTAGRYAVGDAVSVADVFLIPQLYNARRFDVDLTAFPSLRRIEAACQSLEAFERAHPSRQPDAET